MDSIVAKNAKRIIWEKGYKQKAIAERAGYSVNVFNAMLNNRRSIIDKFDRKLLTREVSCCNI